MKNYVDEYRTKDLGEAAALFSLGIELLRMQKDSDFFWFVFPSERSQQQSDDYWSGKLTVNALSYNESLRTLKDRLFARK